MASSADATTVATLLIRQRIVPRPAHQHATTAATKVTSPLLALLHLSQRHATNVDLRATWLETATRILVLEAVAAAGAVAAVLAAVLVAALAAIPRAGENATNVVKSDISQETAPPLRVKAATVAGINNVAVPVGARLATPVEATDTTRKTAPKVAPDKDDRRSAITAVPSVISAASVPSNNPIGSATSANSPATSAATALHECSAA